MIEFYDGERIIAVVGSEMVPPVGAFISIEKQVWKVVKVTYALDYATLSISNRRMRANVDLVRA